mmetsp:Transcript_5274/g.9680  ORF Transcript_5274/g.9680 Transcript_5274/m.9680 type:complete len:103 (+) Transcript_5274:1930-2238(+)
MRVIYPERPFKGILSAELFICEASCSKRQEPKHLLKFLALKNKTLPTPHSSATHSKHPPTALLKLESVPEELGDCLAQVRHIAHFKTRLSHEAECNVNSFRD